MEQNDLLRINPNQIYQPNKEEEYYYQKDLIKGLNIFNLDKRKEITPEPEIIYYLRENLQYETEIIKINNIVLNLLNNLDGRCYKNVIYMLFICNPIFQEYMKLYKDTNLYKIFYIEEYKYTKDKYIKWFEYNFINKYYKNNDKLGNVDIKFLYHFIYGLKYYLNLFYPERIDFNEYIFNHMFNFSVLHNNNLINHLFFSFFLRDNTTTENIINTSNIWINLPGILILCNKTINDIYKVKCNKYITIKSIDNKIYNYTLYGFTFYNNDVNFEHIITVIKDLYDENDNYYIFDNDLYSIYPLELNKQKKVKIFESDKKQFNSLNGGKLQQQNLNQTYQDDFNEIPQQLKTKQINLNYGIMNMKNIDKIDEDKYLSFIYYTDFSENSYYHYFTTYKPEIIMYIRDDFLPKFKNVKKIFNLKK